MIDITHFKTIKGFLVDVDINLIWLRVIGCYFQGCPPSVILQTRDRDPAIGATEYVVRPLILAPPVHQHGMYQPPTAHDIGALDEPPQH